MARGRPAEESAEKSISYDQGSIRYDLQRGLRNRPGPYPTRRKIPEYEPPEKGLKLMRKSKQVEFI